MPLVKQVKSIVKSSSAIIKGAATEVNPGLLYGVILTSGADTATVAIDNSVNGSGTILLKLSASANLTRKVILDYPVPFSIGLYATITGTTPSICVLYE